LSETDEKRVWVDAINSNGYKEKITSLIKESLAIIVPEGTQTITEEQWVKIFCQDASKDKLCKWIYADYLWDELKPDPKVENKKDQGEE
jgi:hypothetical protein